MGKHKNVKFSDEKSVSAPCSPTPRCFREPEGMTDIDLRRLSEMSSFSDASVKKLDTKLARRALCKTLVVLTCVVGATMLLLVVSTTRGSISLQKLFHIERHPQADIDELVAYYMEKLSRCKRDRSLEACCTIFAEGGQMQDCSVDRIVEAIEKRELQSFANAATTQKPDDDDMMDPFDDYIQPEFINNFLRNSYVLIKTKDEPAAANSLARKVPHEIDPSSARTKRQLGYSGIPRQPKYTQVYIPSRERDHRQEIVGTPMQLEQFERPHELPQQVPMHSTQLQQHHFHEDPNTHNIYIGVIHETEERPDAPKVQLKMPPHPEDFHHYQNRPNPTKTLVPLPQTIHANQMRTAPNVPLSNPNYPNSELTDTLKHRPMPSNSEFRHPLKDDRFIDPERTIATNADIVGRPNGENTEIRDSAARAEHRPDAPKIQPKMPPNPKDLYHNHNRQNPTKTLLPLPQTTNRNQMSNAPRPPPNVPLSNPNYPNSELTDTLKHRPMPSNSEFRHPLKDDRFTEPESTVLQGSPANAEIVGIPHAETAEIRDSAASANLRQSNDPKLIQFANHGSQGYANPPCIASFTPPSVGSPLSLIQQQVPVPYDPTPKFAQLVPISMPRNPANPYLINTGYTYFASQPIITNMNAAVHPAAGASAPYYICNPMTTQSGNNVAGMAGVEVRHNVDSNDDMQLLSTPHQRALTRQSEQCSDGQEMCADNSKCISAERVCDDTVNCDDGSDEAYCSCRLRVGAARTCDAYLDCPHGEDEIACRGCTVGFFNCDDWTEVRDATCIPLKQRCDGVQHCPTGRDEQDCAVLLDSIEESTAMFKVSSSEGFLHRNYRGRWYPVCSNGEAWVEEICHTEMDSTRRPALVQPIPINFPYEGTFLSRGPDGRIHLQEECVGNRALHAQCAPPICGLRKTISNAYRAEEVDTSEEEIVTQFRTIRDATTTQNDTILGDGRVVGGKACQPAAWPWVASIYRNGAFHCGGALITDAWLITAAHCVDKYWHFYYEIELGMLRRFSYSPMQQTRFVSDIIAHAGYDRANLKNDLALMRMNAPIKYNRYVRPVCLPTEITAGHDYADAPPANALCTAVGWGATAEHGADPDHLREVEVPVLRNCKHKQDAEGNEICAGLVQGGKDACQGDSGGPFLCRNPNMPDQWYLAGIVSHGEGCARPNEPGVYTRVSMYMDWIYEHTKDDMLPQRRPLHLCPGYTCKGIRKCIPKKRRCDRVVDCLHGDDEVDCGHQRSFSTLFKEALDFMTYRGNKNASPEFVSNDTTTTTNETTDAAKIVGATQEAARFLCTKMLQVLPVSKQCDRVIDCQDGSDESSCTCVDYLRRSHPDAVCDGITDCWNMSDEQDCAPSCTSTRRQFYCRLSKVCIPLSRRCDNTPDCAHSEDEWDCFALTANYRMILDSDERPLVNTKGMLSFYAAGEWRPMCGNFSTIAATLAADVCISLGLTDYDRFLYLDVMNITLRTNDNQTQPLVAPTCPGFYVQCANTTSAHTAGAQEDKLNAPSELAIAPWTAEMYADGEYKCTGVLLNFNWLLTSVHCFNGILKSNENYLVARLAAGKGYLNVQGPNEQIIPITQRIRVSTTDAVVLQLAQPINFTRYVKPLHFQKKSDFLHYRETCLATGRVNETTTMVMLETRRNCSQDARCFVRSIAPQECKVGASWSGCIVCDAGNGFYPAAIFEEPLGSCGFTASRPFPSVAALKRDIFQAMQRTPFVIEAPQCNGHRCPLGKCLPAANVCDGVADCEDGGDERQEMCAQRNTACHLEDGCVCAPDELRCKNSRCVKKFKFCDRSDDCGDASDEPETCSCRAFLHLINPAQICDGVRNCQDRSDEDPALCTCRPGLFQCSNTTECISQEMVCDGTKDCADNSDEQQCFSLKASEDDNRAGEVMTRTAGTWHSGCFPQHMTTTELEHVCEAVGFTGSSASYLKVNVNDTAPMPKLEKFDHFWVHNTEQTGKLMLATRSGRNSFVSFAPSEGQCYKLFIKCI